MAHECVKSLLARKCYYQIKVSRRKSEVESKHMSLTHHWKIQVRTILVPAPYLSWKRGCETQPSVRPRQAHRAGEDPKEDRTVKTRQQREGPGKAVTGSQGMD